MCGISGIVSTKFIDEHAINYLNKIANYQVHRGPDFQDYKFLKKENILFQHQRLSILDLSENSNQPMFSKCNKYCFIFNGEIYNYKELSSLYLGYITDSDTIFLAEIISLLGIQKVIKLLDGMFAIAIYDFSEKNIYLIRDRLGQKPLYYFYNDNYLIFSSEYKYTKAVLDRKDIFYSFSKENLQQLILLGYNNLEDTPFREIKNVKQNTILKFHKSNKIKIISNSNIHNKIESIRKETIKIDNKSYKKELLKFKKSLILSIKQSIRSDVPFGFFLSSGLDSTTLAVLAKLECGIDFPTFTFCDPLLKNDESNQAKLTSEFLNVENIKVSYSKDEIIDLAEKIIKNSDIPPVDSSFLPSYLVCKKASENCKVMIGGDGADELLGGYRRYFNNYSKAYFLSETGSFLFELSKKLGFKNFGKYISYEVKDKLIPFLYPTNLQEYYFYANSCKGLRNLAHNILPDFWGSIYKESFLDVGRITDLIYYLPQDILIKSDRTSMVSSIELRSPYLSNALIEQCQSISFNNKNFKPKQFLLDILSEYNVPYLETHKKGFSISIEEIYINNMNDILIKNIEKFWHKYLNIEILDKIIFNIRNKKNMNELAWRLYSVAKWSTYQ